MQYTGTLSAHQHVTQRRRNIRQNYAKVFNISTSSSNNSSSSACILARGNCEADICSESDTSTNTSNNHKQILLHKTNAKSRRKLSWIFHSSTCAFLVLICLVVNLEYVIGALHNIHATSLSSSSSLTNVNYFDNSTNFTRTLVDDIDDVPYIHDVDINDIENFTVTIGSRLQPIYQNEFAVHIFGGVEKANGIAKTYGFTNMGQVSLSQ